MDLLDPAVRADLFNPDRPIRTKDQSNPSTYYGPDAKSIHSLVADGCFIEGEVENSILSRGVIVEAGAKVSNSVLMQGTIIQRRCLPVLHHHRQERAGESGPDADGPLHLSAGHLQGLHRLIAGEAPDRTRGLPPR